MCKKIIVFVFFIFSLQSFGQTIPEKPSPPRLINDFTETLSRSEQNDLEQTVDIFNDSTSTQIAVVIVASTQGDDVNDFAFQVGRKWGVGSKEFNNGVVLLVAKDDHQIAIATGYGVEGALPDITAKQIISNDIVPQFKQGDYYGGIKNGINSIIEATKGEYKASPHDDDNSGSGAGIFIVIVIIVIIILSIFRRGGGGGMMSRNGFGSFLGPFLLGNLLGGGFRGGGGGGGFGGGGGGGFGGFGGGGFGGGGASGGW